MGTGPSLFIQERCRELRGGGQSVNDMGEQSRLAKNIYEATINKKRFSQKKGAA